MITQVESGLTVDQYNALKDATSGASWSLTAHKYNLDFSETGVDQGRDNDTPDFDAAAYGDYVYRVIGNLLERYDTVNEMWYECTAYTGIAGLIDTDSPNIVVDGSAMYIYAATSDGIHIINTTDNAESFSAWSTVVSDDAVNKIAAVNKDRIHYTQMNSDKNIYQLRVAKFSGTWSITASDVYYTYPFSNFVAAELPDGGDMIVAATQVPGITTVKLVVNVPTKYIKQQGGIIGFKYKNDWWGDHYDIDVVDELTAYRFRDRIKLTQFSDRLALTCYSSDGTQLFPYTMYRIYTTKDGVYWSKGNALPLPDDVGSSGAKLCQLGDYVYAVEKSRAYKSLMTMYLGYSPSVCQLVIPHRRISQMSLSEGEMMQGSIVFSNEDGWLDNDTIISPQNRTVLVFRMGYWVNGENFQVQTNMAEIDTYDKSHSLPRKLVKVTFRDFLAWMTDINSAERPYYWDSQLLGGDNFIDTTNDKYGGLRHLEPQAGSFTSEGSNLNLTSNNEEGVGFSTFSLYLWNGITQSQFTLSTVGNSEYGGITFRSIDKDNFWHASYLQSDDKIRLEERSGGAETLKAQSSALSWASTPETPRWIQVEFRYAHIVVRYSTDGITWTDCIDYLMDIVSSDLTPDLALVSTANKERGYVGFLGRGYAPPDVETWPADPPPYEDPPYYPSEPPYFPPYDPSYPGPYTGSVYVPGSTTGTAGTGLHTTGNPKKAIVVTHSGDVYRTTNLDANEGTCDWELAFKVPHYTTYYKKDPKVPKRRWFGTEEGLYYCSNMWASLLTNTVSSASAFASLASHGTSTNIRYALGETITITATGTWDAGFGTIGPTGDGSPSDLGVPGSSRGALIGKVGTGSWFYVGAGITIPSPNLGTLYLKMDRGGGGVAGYLDVSISGGKIEGSVPVTLKATSAAMFNASGVPVYQIHMSEKRPNWMLVQNINSYYSISETLGSLWDCLDYTTGSAVTGVPYDSGNNSTFGFWSDGMVVPYGDVGDVFACHGYYDGLWHYQIYNSDDWGHTFTPVTPNIGIGGGAFINSRLYDSYRRENGNINKVNDLHEVFYYAGTGTNEYPGINLSRDRGLTALEDYDIADGTSSGFGHWGRNNPTYSSDGWYTSITPNYGDQFMYCNPQTYKRKYIVLKQRGYANRRSIFWSADNFETVELVEGFEEFFNSGAIPNSAQDIHFVGYPTNWNFLFVGTEAVEGVFGYVGNVYMTPNKGENWFDMATDSGLYDQMGGQDPQPDPKQYSNYHPIAVDVEA